MRETPSRKSGQATTSEPPAPAQEVGSVRTRKVPPGSSGNPPGAGRLPDSVVTLLTATWDAEKESPPSVDFTNLIVFPAIQKITTAPSSMTVMEGDKESGASGHPTACAPTPRQVAPWSSVRAKASCEPLSQAT